MIKLFSKPKKKPLRYKVVVKGITISKHSTKKNADKKAKNIRTAKVIRLRRNKRRSYKRRY